MSSSSGQRVPSYQVAAVLQNQGPKFSFETHKLAIPTINPQEVLVELNVTGFCGTNISLACGYLGPCQTILGHEGVGRISAVGSSCTSEAATVGRLVGVGWIRDACGSCRVCDSDIKDESRCIEQVFSGRDVPGTLARYTVVPERYITPLPDRIPSEMLAPVMCAGVTGYKALKVANIATGAEVYLDFENEDSLRSAVLLKTEGMLCSAIIVCAGAASAHEQALNCLDYHGTLVAVGIPPPASNISLHPLSLIGYGIQIVGSIAGDRVDIAEAAEFVRKELVKPRVTKIGIHELENYAGRVNELDGKLVVRLGPKVG
ncbi:unnamed protein product [Penicillium discolor]